MAGIIISTQGESQRGVCLSKKRLIIGGRGSHNDVVIDHPDISIQHAAIVTNSDGIFVEDLGSINGTKVNG
jgi:pSer/pThr/pTyr-binding forkhead associated (FHA) protein